MPLRPIVSLPGSPTYNVAKYLYGALKNIIEGSPHSISSSEEAIQKLGDITIDNDEIMISYDVESLFTSIDVQMAEDVIK